MNSNGVGLGLVISKQITEQFEGDIHVESQIGVGSDFTFYFKLHKPVQQLPMSRMLSVITKNDNTHYFSNDH